MGSISPTISLDVIVVGAGIAGLSAAIALRRAGHNVTVYEKYPADALTGAGIGVGANATRVLRQWGLDPESVGMLRYKVGEIRECKTLEVRQLVYGPGSHVNREESNGDSQMMTTRQALRELLMGEVQRDVPGEGGKVELRFDREVVDYDAERPAIKFANGEWKDSDLVIACDGIKTKAAERIGAGENPPKATGFSVFRLLIPDEQLRRVGDRFKNDKEISSMFDQEAGRVWFVAGLRKLVVWWKCNFGKIQAFDLIIPDNERYASSEEWSARCDRQVLLDELTDWHPLFSEIVKAAEDNPFLWKICAREPLSKVYKGKLCLTGDALHPMPPFRGQGGSQGIEDAGALEIVLSELRDKEEVSSRLRLWEQLRVPRFSAVQLVATVRQDEPNMDERYAEMMEQCRKFFEGKDQTHCKSWSSR